MKIYTKTGDRGQTSLVDGARVSKSHPRVEAYGTVDEINSLLGVCVAQLRTLGDSKLKSHTETLEKIQNLLFDVGSHLACENPAVLSRLPILNPQVVSEMEHAMDGMDQELPPLKEFILPGGHLAASHLHMARTVCRRAERLVVSLNPSPDVDFSIQVLNRLSDYLFVLARYANFLTSTPEVKWKK